MAEDSVIVHQASVVDVSFPGDILIGMDLLRRLDFTFSSEASTGNATITLQGHKFSVVYTDAESLKICCIKPLSPTEDASEDAPVSAQDPQTVAAVHLVHRASIAAHSGCFVEGCVSRNGPTDGDILVVPAMPKGLLLPHAVTKVKDRRCSVWVVNATPKPMVLHNGTRLGKAEQVEAIYTNDPSQQLPKMPEEVVARSNYCPVEPDSLEDGETFDFEWEEDCFDRQYGVEDFGYDDELEVEHMELPPSIAIAACEAAELLEHGPNLDDHPMPDLGHLEDPQRHQLTELLCRFKGLFDGGEEAVGLVPGIKHQIDTGDAKPVCIRQWRLPHSTRQVIREQCDSMLRSGVIEESTSPWMSPVVLVKKKGGALRFCVDYRGLNAVTKGDTYPLPLISELIDELGPKNIFTTLDARAAYWSVELEEEDRPKTAFSDGYRLFQFCRLPFGLSTAPTTFQRTMNVVLSSVLGRHTLAYLDDVIIYSHNFDQHLQDLDETLQLLSLAGLKLNMDKCQFAATTIDFLGFTISPDGVSPNKDKVLAISNTPPPRTVREVRRFLGATGFFRKHVPGYATLASPLHLLLKKDQAWTWGPEQQAAFETLKEKLTSAPVLRQPDFSKGFELHTDASSIALGACLMQRDDDQTPHAVAYFSRKLRDAETRYPAIDLEALAVVEGVRTFDSYLYGRRFTVYTDHRPLVYVFSRKTKSPRMTRFAHDLSFYDFSIRYKEGPTNKVPDLLSRQVAKLTITELSPESLAEEQKADPQLAEICSYLEGGNLPTKKLPLPLADFELKEGVLYRLKNLPDRIVYQLVVPVTLRNSALKASHLPPLASHPGIHRTFQNARSMFYWPNMLKDVRQYVECCEICQQSRGDRQKVPMAETPLSNFPLERVSMDIMDFGPSIPIRWALSIIDQHSRYLQIIPLRKVTAVAVHRAFLDHWVTLFGPPRVIQTDNGVQFTSNLFKELAKLMHATNHYTIRYHPQANGLIERTNRVVKSALTSLVNDRPRTWHQFVPELRLQINSAIHRTTGEQPLYMLTGRHANFQIGLTNEAVFDENVNLQARLREARQAAVKASKEARQIYGKQYNKGKKVEFQPTEGALVWYFEHRHKMGGLPPLTRKWRGPARIIRRLGPVAFEIEDLETEVQFRAHLNHLKAYHPPAELSYGTSDDDDDDGDNDDDGTDDPNPPNPDDPWVAVLTSLVMEPEFDDSGCGSLRAAETHASRENLHPDEQMEH